MALVDQATAFWRFGDPLSSNKLVDALGRGNDLTPFLRPAPVTLDFRMGSSNNPMQQLFGALAKWGKWNRALTVAEKAALYGGEAWPFATTASLKDAVAYYLLNEATGTLAYNDATGRGNVLRSAGTPSQTAGPTGGSYATLFEAGDSLWRPYTSDLQTGNYPWTIAGWVKLTGPIVTGAVKQQVFWGQWQTSGQTSGTNVYFDSTTLNEHSFCLDGGFPNYISQGPVITDTNALNPSADTWYCLVSEYDPATNLLSLTVNNTTTASLGPIQQPVPVPGRVGYGSHFRLNPAFDFGTLSGWDGPAVPDGSCHASMRRTADVSFGNESFTVWRWIKCDETVATQTVIGIFDPNIDAVEWAVQVSAGKLFWVIGNGGNVYEFNNATSIDTNWHLFICWYDKANGKLCVSLDGAAPAEKTIAVTPGAMYGNARLLVGAASRNDASEYSIGQQFRGALNAVGIARGVPSAADRAALWNGGAGIALGKPRRGRAGDVMPHP
jgi:hypothetical protein